MITAQTTPPSVMAERCEFLEGRVQELQSELAEYREAALTGRLYYDQRDMMLEHRAARLVEVRRAMRAAGDFSVIKPSTFL